MGSTPLTFRCSRCKVGRDYRHESPRYDSTSHIGIEVTGRQKPAVRRRRRRGIMVEYKHTACGFVGWTTHPSIVSRAVRNANAPPKSGS